MATELAKRYRDDLTKVAELVVRRQDGDPEYGLVTRLIPLKEPPDLKAVDEALGPLRGRYFEIRTANFFIFGQSVMTTNRLVIKGTVRSFTVNPAEAAGGAHINPRPHKQAVEITLRHGDARPRSTLRAVPVILVS